MQEMQETQLRSLGPEDSLEKEMATHWGILGWKVPWTEVPGGLQSVGSQRNRHDWVTNTECNSSLFLFLWDMLQFIPSTVDRHLGGFCLALWWMKLVWTFIYPSSGGICTPSWWVCTWVWIIPPQGVCMLFGGFPGGSAVKNLPAMQEMQETLVWSLCQEDPLEEEMATHPNILAWEIPWMQKMGTWKSSPSFVTYIFSII